MEIEGIFEEIRNAFGALWKCRLRGASVEIITPFPTATDMYVSVFLTRRDDCWIATDGGWICSGVYQCELPEDDKIFSRILEFYEEENGISKTHNNSGVIFYFKGTRRRELIPNIIFDVATFISAIISNACIQLKEETERIAFRTSVKNWISKNTDNTGIKYNSFISASLRVKFGAVVDRHPNALSVINFVSATQYPNFRSGMAASNWAFDLLAQTPADRKVAKKIVLLDDTNIPFSRSYVDAAVSVCQEKGRRVMSWVKDKEELLEVVSA